MQYKILTGPVLLHIAEIKSTNKREAIFTMFFCVDSDSNRLCVEGFQINS